ncbi:unnamed protein product [Boreogadus saida]
MQCARQRPASGTAREQVCDVRVSVSDRPLGQRGSRSVMSVCPSATGLWDTAREQVCDVRVSVSDRPRDSEGAATGLWDTAREQVCDVRVSVSDRPRDTAREQVCDVRVSVSDRPLGQRGSSPLKAGSDPELVSVCTEAQGFGSMCNCA